MIVSGFTTFTENCVICCSQITKIFCTRYGSANASSARGSVILVLWQISQFRSLGKWVKTLCLPKSSLVADEGSKDSSWEELACESLCSGTLSSTRFSLNYCSHSGISEHNGSLRSILWSSFLFGLLFGWLWSTSLPVLSLQHVYSTQLLDKNLSCTGHPVLV